MAGPPSAIKEINLAAPPEILQTIEGTALSTWIRESTSLFGFWFILSWHAMGMALLVGASMLIAFRMMGIARDLPVAPLKRLYTPIWVGFWIQLVSGVLLVIGYPTKSFTTLMFYIKLVLIALAMTAMVRLKKRVFDNAGLSEVQMIAQGRTLAVWSLVFWISAVTAGRFIAYTYTYATYPTEGSAALLDAAVALLRLAVR
jgi:hypothetical protein